MSTIAQASPRHQIIHLNNLKQNTEIFWDKPEGSGPWPLLIFLHPHQEWPNKIGGEVFVKNNSIETWTKNNFVTVAISMPGYGKTEGSADFCGPLSQKTVDDVVNFFSIQPYVEKNKIFLYGGSRGAVIAALLATKNQYAGVVLKSGVYDFEVSYDSLPWYNPIKLTMLWELGFNNREKLKERTVLPLAEKIKSPLLIIHGLEDDRASFEVAKAFAQKVKSFGTSVEFVSLESEHFIPMDKVRPYMEKFFGGILK